MQLVPHILHKCSPPLCLAHVPHRPQLCKEGMPHVFYIPMRFELPAVFLDTAKTSATKSGWLLTRALMAQRLPGDESNRGSPDFVYMSPPLGLHTGLKYIKDKPFIRRRLKGSMCRIDAECLKRGIHSTFLILERVVSSNFSVLCINS